MGRPGEFSRAVGTELVLGKDGDVAPMIAHLGYRAIFLSKFQGLIRGYEDNAHDWEEGKEVMVATIPIQ